MSGFESVGIILAVLPVALLIISSPGFQYRQARFGTLGHLIYVSRQLDTDALQQMHWDINAWTDAQILDWKNAHISTCNAVSVAAAIFASIGLTALQLPNFNNVHWTARAFCSTSMLLGVLSVTTATSQQNTISMLKSPLEIRLWLSRGKPDMDQGLPLGILKDLFKNRLMFKGTKLPSHKAEKSKKYQGLEDFDDLPLESSVSALKAISLPRNLLNLAVLLFIVGFGLYLLFSWLDNVDNDGISYRNIFIFFILTVGLFVTHYLTISVARIFDEEKRNYEFSTKTLGGFLKPEPLRDLEEDLLGVQSRMETASKLVEQDLADVRELLKKSRLEREQQLAAEHERLVQRRAARDRTDPDGQPETDPQTSQSNQRDEAAAGPASDNVTATTGLRRPGALEMTRIGNTLSKNRISGEITEV